MTLGKTGSSIVPELRYAHELHVLEHLFLDCRWRSCLRKESLEDLAWYLYGYSTLCISGLGRLESLNDLSWRIVISCSKDSLAQSPLPVKQNALDKLSSIVFSVNEWHGLEKLKVSIQVLRLGVGKK
jgi:hypothetical protein